MPSRNVFISHHGKDDGHIDELKSLLSKSGYALKNSSIDSTKPNEASNLEYIRQLLRDRIAWAKSFVVLIGPQTHERDWVNWEIEQAAKQGKRIVGIYIRGATDSVIPENFEKFGDALVGWNTDVIIGAIDGRVRNWETPDGTERNAKWIEQRGTC